MSVQGIAFLVLVVSALSLFGGVLAWASWMEGRENKRKAAKAIATEPHDDVPSHAPLHRAF